MRQWGTTGGRGDEKDPKSLLLACLHSYFPPPSPCLSHEAASQAGQQPSLSGTTALSQPSRWHQWKLLCCRERTLLCQNLKLARGDAIGAGITPVIAVNRKDLGSCFTEIRNPQTLLVGPYLSTLIIEGCSQISLVLYLAQRGESNYAKTLYQIFVRKAPVRRFCLRNLTFG